jgi:putative DNA primase/helicase
MSNDRFQEVVRALEAKGPNARGWYSAKCPAHDDIHASLGFTDGKRGIGFKCQSGCKRPAIIAAIEKLIGKKLGSKSHEKPEAVTLAAYAHKTQLPGIYLQAVWRSVEWPSPYGGDTVLTVPYFNEQFKCVGLKYRVSLSGEGPKYLWDKDKYPKTEDVPYGLAQLLTRQRNSKWDGSTVVLCEGESDTQVLNFCQIPALGISGANSWRPEFADIGLLRDAKKLLVIQEPPKEGAKEDAGANFVKAISDSFPSQPGKVIPVKFKQPLKDPCALWADDPDDFRAEWGKLVAAAHDDLIPFTHTGNTERLVAKFGENFRWLQDADEFRTWNGEVWEPSRNGDGALLECTKEVVRSIANEKWARTSESLPQRKAMISLSKGERQVFSTRNQFNRRPMLLNVANGCLDLETQTIRDFSRDDCLTFKSPIVWDPISCCPQFDDFLNFTFGGDEELIHFIVKAMAYSLTGDGGEQCFFMCHGNGGNGKSQLLGILRLLLGPNLAVQAKFDTFLETRGFNNTEYELASFAGARVVTAVEPSTRGRFNEEMLKQITGDDMVKARPIYGHPFEYKATFKLWLAMNNVPKLTGTDEGIWRRVRYIPFNQTVPPDRRIKDLAEKLVDEEGPGILNRLLEGVAAWQREGLNPPSVVRDATANFRVTQDTFGRFVADRCVLVSNAKTKCGELYDAYKLWAESQNEYVMTAFTVAHELDIRGFEKRRWQGSGNHGEYRFGIGLLGQ